MVMVVIPNVKLYSKPLPVSRSGIVGLKSPDHCGRKRYQEDRGNSLTEELRKLSFQWNDFDNRKTKQLVTSLVNRKKLSGLTIDPKVRD